MPAKKIIVIMTDSQRWDMLGCYGNKDMHTPHLDRLAAGGIRFDRAYCCQPVCGPARAALFTGTYPHSNGGWANSMALGDNVKSIGQRLRDNGLHTAYIGKWHLDGGDYFGLGRCPDGWDPAYWYDMRRYLEELTPEERFRSRQSETSRDPNLKSEFTFGHRCAERATQFLERHGGENFLLVVSFDEPHGPWLCPKQYSDMYRDYEWPKPKNVRDPLSHKPEHQRLWAGGRLPQDKDKLRITHPEYLACNAFADVQIGRVVDAIDRLAPDALVIYTSDHGDMLQSHSLTYKGPVMYDEITRIPLLIRYPGVAPSAAVCPHPVSHINIVPTILEAAGLSVPKIIEGRGILDTLKDPRLKQNDTVFMEYGRFALEADGFGGFQPIRCAFDGRYKLTINLLCTDELYDLQSDPDEMVNLIESAEHANIRNTLHDRLLDWMNGTRDPFRGYYWERRPWRTDARPVTWAHTGMTRDRENEEYEPRHLDYATGLDIVEAVRKK